MREDIETRFDDAQQKNPRASSQFPSCPSWTLHQKTPIDVAFVSRRVLNILVKHAGHKTIENVQPEKIGVASGATLETMNKAFRSRNSNVDDRLSD